MGYYIHQVPGRLRVRTPLVKKDPECAQSLVRTLQQFRGVHSVKVSVTTGSIVVSYDDTSVDSSQLMKEMRRSGVLGNVIAFPSRSAGGSSSKPSYATTGKSPEGAPEVASSVKNQIVQLLVEKAISHYTKKLFARVF